VKRRKKFYSPKKAHAVRIGKNKRKVYAVSKKKVCPEGGKKLNSKKKWRGRKNEEIFIAVVQKLTGGGKRSDELREPKRRFGVCTTEGQECNRGEEGYFGKVDNYIDR